jgi:hypothetical protein
LRRTRSDTRFDANGVDGAESERLFHVLHEAFGPFWNDFALAHKFGAAGHLHLPMFGESFGP